MTDGDAEKREGEPQGRKVVLHFVRHGEAGYSGRDDGEGFLTEKGKEQARGIAAQIYQELPKGAVVEFLSSNRERAEQTTKAIQEKIKELEENSRKDLVFHNDKIKSFNHLGISDEITDEYLDLIKQEESPIRFWLENPGKTPMEAQRNLGGFLRHMARFTSHLKPGSDVHVIFAVHSGPTEVFLGQLFNDSSIESLANCEQFIVELPVAGKSARVKFKDLDKTVELANE